MKLYCATTNAGKLKEFQLAVEQFGQDHFEIELAPDLHSLSPCEEDGATFEENAVSKALYYSTLAPGPALRGRLGTGRGRAQRRSGSNVSPVRRSPG